jgi:hypothetical protein
MQTTLSTHSSHGADHSAHNHAAMPDHKASSEFHDHALCEIREHSERHAAHEKGQQHASVKDASNLRLAIMATLHCLLGCGIGEIVGVVIGTALGLGMVETMVLAVFLGFVFGFALGMIPLLRGGIGFAQAFRIILVSEGISIAVMESAEVLVQVYTPGVMEAGLTDSLFWIGMTIALAAGFVAALPVNIVLIRRGIRHHH